MYMTMKQVKQKLWTVSKSQQVWVSDHNFDVRLEVFMTKNQVSGFWVVTPCSDVVFQKGCVASRAAWPSKTLASHHITTWCHNPEDLSVNEILVLQLLQVTVN